MTEYTPADEDVHAAFMLGAAVPTPHPTEAESRAMFDRWLAARDARVKAEALREAAEVCGEGEVEWALRNTRYWLRARADRIEQEVTT